LKKFDQHDSRSDSGRSSTWPLDHHRRKQQPHMWIRASRSWLSTRSRGPINYRCSIHLYCRIYGATSTMYIHIRVPCRVLHLRSWWLLVNVNVPREVAVTLLGHKRPDRIIANIPILYPILLYKKQSCYWRHKITTLVLFCWSCFGLFQLISAYSLSHNTIESTETCRLSYLPNQPISWIKQIQVFYKKKQVQVGTAAT
jgi:hypothetical protein